MTIDPGLCDELDAIRRVLRRDDAAQGEAPSPDPAAHDEAPPPDPAAHDAAPPPDPAAHDEARSPDPAAHDAAPSPDRAPRAVPALDAVCALFGLSRFERSLLVLCAGVELDGGLAELCASATAHGQPTFGLALAVLTDAHWSAIAPVAPLRRWRLLRLAPGASLTAAPLQIDERILHLLAGIAHLDATLDGIASEVPPAPAILTPTHAAAAERVAAALHAGRGRIPRPVVQICGRQPRTRLDVASHAAARCGLGLLRIDGEALPSEPRELAELRRMCAREAALCGAAIALEPGDAGPVAARFAEGLEAPLLVCGREPVGGLDRGTRVDVEPPTVVERRELWRAALGDRHEALNGTLDALVAQFHLDPADVLAASEEALAAQDDQLAGVLAASDEALAAPDGELADRVWQACRVRARPALDDLAQRIASPACWDDIVVGEPQRRTLEEIAAQVRRRARVHDDWGFARLTARGLGIAALFCGPSGTGKTLAAEVLANELSLDLYRIDLSQVVSKYIGETEKNLRRVFDAAEGGGAVLLFDEADALFGKRTEVKDSHDRYANIEVSYLLQRVEAFSGLAILTTNQRGALDEAFLRRLRFIVEFPFPAVAERAAIWSRAFPSAVPLASLDRDRLAQLAVPGANIRNIALGAAFLAADAEASVSMDHILRATRSEYAKLERPLSPAELEGWA